MKTRNIVRLALAAAILLLMFPLSAKNAHAAGEVWTVTYHTNGGTPVASVQVKDGDYAPYGNTTREGYLLQGWYTNPELTDYGGSLIVHSNVDLYAKWNALIPVLSATVTKPVEGAHPSTDIVIPESSHSWAKNGIKYYDVAERRNLEPSDVFERGKVYRIYVWFTPDTGYDISRNDTKAYINGISAVWWGSLGDGYHTCSYYIESLVPDPSVGCKLIFDLNDQGYETPTGGPGSVSCYLGEELTLPSTAPRCVGYSFLGWSRSRYSSEPEFKAGDKYQVTSASEYLFAVWKMTPPKIASQPQSTTAIVGDTVEFTVLATGYRSLSYRWQYLAPGSDTWKDSTQAGADTATLTVTTNQYHHGYKYRCVVQDFRWAETVSKEATLSIQPKITKQPKNGRAVVGDPAEFTVTATGKAKLKYQWQAKSPSAVEWSNSTQSGAKTAKLTVATNVNHNGYQYRCIVTDGNGMHTISKEVTLYIFPKITKDPEDRTVEVGCPAGFSVEAYGKGTLKYQWQYKGPKDEAWADSTQNGAETATLAVNATVNHNGYLYRCIVTDGNGKSNISGSAELTVRPRITTQPKSQSAKAGNSVTLTVAAIGKAKLTYQWQCKAPGATEWSDSTQTGAKTAKLTIKTTKYHNGYQYRCVVTDGNSNSTESLPATLTITN